MRKFPALGSALVLALTGAFVAAPALAHTHHPSTPQERQQTRELNLQSLQQAEGQAPANQQAMNATQQQPAAQMQDQKNQPMNSSPAGQTNAQPTGAEGGGQPANANDSTAQEKTQPTQQQQQTAPGGY